MAIGQLPSAAIVDFAGDQSGLEPTPHVVWPAMIIHHSEPRKAAATVEFAVLLPFLLFITVIATDWARLFYFTITIEACARNGALYLSDDTATKRSPYASLTAAALAESPNLQATVTSSTTTDAAGNAAVIVTVTMPFKTITNFPGVPSTQSLTRTVQMRVVPQVTR